MAKRYVNGLAPPCHTLKTLKTPLSHDEIGIITFLTVFCFSRRRWSTLRSFVRSLGGIMHHLAGRLPEV